MNFDFVVNTGIFLAGLVAVAIVIFVLIATGYKLYMMVGGE